MLVTGVPECCEVAWRACLAFLAARFLFRDRVKEKFSDSFKAIDEGVEREGEFYLFIWFAFSTRISILYD